MTKRQPHATVGSAVRAGDSMSLTPDDIINFVRLYSDNEGKNKECSAGHGCGACYYKPFCHEDRVDAFIKELEPFAMSVKDLRSTMESQEKEIARLKLAVLDGRNLKFIEKNFHANSDNAEKEEIRTLKGELEYCRSEKSRLIRAIQALIWEMPQSP